jgi:hypothetical protein
MAGNKGIVSAQFYTFSAANRTITFTNDYAGLDLGEITYITNIKNGVATVIYDPFDATKGGTLSGLTLTLAYDTTLMANTDPLQIITGFTPLNADPTPVRIVEGPDQIDDTALLQNISDNLDFLNLALDQNEGIQINTRDVNPAKRDTNNAQIPSDAPNAIPVRLDGKILNDQVVFDTTGYNTLVITIQIPSVWGASFTVESYNDTTLVLNPQYVVWSGAPNVTSVNTGQPSQFANVGYTLIIPCIHRFVRLRITSSISIAGIATGTAYLRQALFPTGPFNQIPVSANINQIAGTAPSVNSITPAGVSGAFTGGIGISGYLTHVYGNTLSPAGQTLSTAVPNAIGIGGREQPYVGQLAGLLRYFNLDNRGNQILGGDTAFRTPNMGGALEQSSAGTARGIGGVLNNIQGAQSLTVADTNQNEGDTDNMLLAQILKELKILNQNFAELPQILNQANYPISDPQEYRNDTNFQ